MDYHAKEQDAYHKEDTCGAAQPACARCMPLSVAANVPLIKNISNFFLQIKSAFGGGIRAGDLGVQIPGETTREFVCQSDMYN